MAQTAVHICDSPRTIFETLSRARPYPPGPPVFYPSSNPASTSTSHPQPPFSQSLGSAISNALVAPPLEAGLHLLNGDLYAAHFLVRKMQTGKGGADGALPGRGFGLWAHAILHRLEGDWENARAWYRDVANLEPSDDGGPAAGKAWFDKTWSRDGSEPYLESSGFLDESAAFKARHPLLATHPSCVVGLPSTSPTFELVRDNGEYRRLAERSWHELLGFCNAAIAECGWTAGIQDASGWYESSASDEKKNQMMQTMVGGGEGWRRF